MRRAPLPGRSRAFRCCAAVVIAAALVGLGSTHADPALANVQKCYWNPTTTYRLPGEQDVRVRHQVCVIKFSGARYKAWIFTRWSPVGGGAMHHRFDAFKIQVRFEQDDEVAGYAPVWCDITSQINHNKSGTQTCQTKVAGPVPRPDMANTGDGKVVVNVDGDGKGAATHQLHGSPVV